MGFSAPLGLIALVGIPLVLLLHRLRRRLLERRVAGLFLFAPDTLSETAGRTVSPLLRTASLWLELLGALLLALLLAGPRFDGGRPPRHLVVVLDDTASMGAKSDAAGSLSGRTVADEARRFVQERIAALASDDVVTLVRTGRPPTLLAGPRVTRGAAAAALGDWKPVGTSHDRMPALDLGVQFAGPDDDVLFVTDEAEPETPPRVEVAAFGRPQDGAAIASARRFSGPVAEHEAIREVITVDVVAYAQRPYSTEVTVRVGLDGDGGSRVVAKKALTVDPARPERLTLEVPASDLPLRVSLSPDALDLDGDAVLLPERIRVVPYRVEMSPESAAALRLDRLALAVPGIRSADEAAAALLFTDNDGPGVGGSAITRVVVSPATAGPAAAAERDDWLGPFLVDRAHALVEGLTLEGVVWSAGKGPLRGRGLVFAGEQALLSEEVTDGQTILRLNLDPARSTLAASADWPILLSNIVERARSSLPGPTSTTARVGESIAYRLSASQPTVAGWRLVAPSGREEPARGRGLLVFEPSEAGVHRLVTPSGEVARFAVQFVDGRESDLRGRGSARRPPRPAPGGPTTSPEAPEASLRVASALPTRLLALLLLGVVAADAWVLARTSGARPRSRSRARGAAP